MDQWDENRQDWTDPDLPEGPPPGTRTARVAVVTAVAVVLCAVAGMGIWAWARDGGSSNAGSPGGSLPSAPYGAETASGDAAGSGEVPSHPCAAVSYELAQEWGLQHDTTMTEPGCRWAMQDDGRTSFIVLRYSDEPPAQWDSVSPIAVDGVPSATSVKVSNSICMVMWPTSYGSANVSAIQGYNAGGEDVCDAAADFTAAVAPNVPG
ncbi:DUF3558 family protein [Streptomyces dysideae]|uniref:DUF3558 domain-containing protein n=1 Tax=Streptomyces dysideae TaxID=909626 RepID=A0A117S2G9_9ACTN|nr:DUF3558 family protein [Streptomyces dysideae]KUO22414.1 hypothetical protein AQJ91_03860 [Streptomyces dysideae]